MGIAKSITDSPTKVSDKKATGAHKVVLKYLLTFPSPISIDQSRIVEKEAIKIVFDDTGVTSANVTVKLERILNRRLLANFYRLLIIVDKISEKEAKQMTKFSPAIPSNLELALRKAFRKPIISVSPADKAKIIDPTRSPTKTPTRSPTKASTKAPTRSPTKASTKAS